MLHALQAIFEGLAHWRGGRAWLAIPFLGIGILIAFYSCGAKVSENWQAAAIKRAMPEALSDWTYEATTTTEDGEGKTKFSRRFVQPGKRMLFVLKPGRVLTRQSDDDYLRETANTPGRARSIERIGGYPVYLDRRGDTMLTANALVGDRAMITVVLFATGGRRPANDDILGYLKTVDYPAIIETLRDLR